MSYEKVVRYYCDVCEIEETTDGEDELPRGWFNVEDILSYSARYEGDMSICENCVTEVAMELFREHVIAEG